MPLLPKRHPGKTNLWVLEVKTNKIFIEYGFERDSLSFLAPSQPSGSIEPSITEARIRESNHAKKLGHKGRREEGRTLLRVVERIRRVTWV